MFDTDANQKEAIHSLSLFFAIVAGINEGIFDNHAPVGLNILNHATSLVTQLCTSDALIVDGNYCSKMLVRASLAASVGLGVSYDDTWSILSNVRQLLPNIDLSHIKSRNVSIAHLRTYLTVAADREDDITIAHVFIIFMMGHLWFQTANDNVPLGYLAAVADLDSAAQYDWGSAILASLYYGLDTAVTSGGAITGFVQLLTYWFYEYCRVGHPIVKEEVKFSAYPRLRVWGRGNRKKTNDQATNLLIIGRCHSDHRMIKTITWEPWLEFEVSEIEDVLIAKLISRKRMPLQVPNGTANITWRIDAGGSWKARCIFLWILRLACRHILV
ncbi:hypothetical protein GIB67_004423 [Kingdonia uniflora]|uniref:Aminotransferase-like plant mobile domain-containing protein n=1 Tax=Kingdonia uniflora TaxID=39325 RepID=A0A7J7MRE3_9MAGN|nr:hypothetical protein GIB67_004423 [Kingdonia uniflora]